MHPGPFDLVQRHDGPFQLPFDRPAIVDLLGELGEAEITLIEQFEADAAGLGKPLRSHAQPQFGHLLRGHAQRTVVDAVFDVLLLELGHHRAGVLSRQVRVERAKIPLAVPLREHPQPHADSSQCDANGNLLAK